MIQDGEKEEQIEDENEQLSKEQEGILRTETKVVMRKVAYAIKKSKMPNKEHQLKILKEFGTATSERL